MRSACHPLIDQAAEAAEAAARGEEAEAAGDEAEMVRPCPYDRAYALRPRSIRLARIWTRWSPHSKR